MTRAAIVAVVAVSFLAPAPVQVQAREPIIDVHLHASAANSQGPPPIAMCTPIDPMPAWDQRTPFGQAFLAMFKTPPCADPVWSPRTDAELIDETVATVRRLNIWAVLSGPLDRMDRWLAAEPERFFRPGVVFNIGQGNAPGVDALRERHAQKKLAVIGEVANQYSGMAPDDPLMEPYWRLAEELDIPVGYHVGTPPPGALYLGFNTRARLHSALLLEEVLARHRRLRLYVMHAGYPLLDDMLAMLYAHPQLYVDVGVIVYTQPRPAFYRYLQALVESGFGNRVMFGSDQMVWPGTIERSIAVINEAPFLSAAQKRDILYNNAARFLRLSPEEMARHQGK
jgi:predicted TIM-barrel fold metal-dependent hydrolase